jgi:hypothetical protein
MTKVGSLQADLHNLDPMTTALIGGQVITICRPTIRGRVYDRCLPGSTLIRCRRVGYDKLSVNEAANAVFISMRAMGDDIDVGSFFPDYLLNQTIYR